MNNLWQDLRYSLRMLAKHPAFTFVIVFTLALGIGANAALFSVANVVLLNPFPYPEHGQLFFVRQRLPKIGVQEQQRASGPEFIDFTESKSFERVAAIEPVSRNLTGNQEAERVAAAKVSADFFSLLGVEPTLGRTISAADQGPSGERVLVISHGLWQRRFGGEADVLGQKIYLDDEPYTIIGVMPPGFYFDAGEAWFPFPFDFNQTPRSARIFPVIARLKPEVTLTQAKAELEMMARNQEEAFVGTNPEYAGREIYLQPLSEFYFGTVQRALLILMGAVGLILLIACTNIANLLLARASSREREVAIRAALGASRFRLVRQMLTESTLLALLGGTLSLLLALWGIDALVARIPTDTLPPGVKIGIDAGVLLFALVVSLLTALLFGLWPALSISKPQLHETLKEGVQKASTGHRGVRAQKLLVVSEVALSLLLLVMAGLMIRSFARLTRVDPGFDPENVLSMRLNLSPARSKGGQQNAVFFQQLIERVQTVPGVQSVAVASHMPFVFTEDWTVTVESRAVKAEAQTQNVDTRTISPDYFRVLEIPLLKGEYFSAEDRPDSPGVVIINETMARRFWPNEDALGKRIKLGRAEATNPWLTVKGVVSDSAQGALDASIKPEVYFPMAQMAHRYRRMNLAVRTGADPMSLVSLIKKEVQAMDKDQPVYQIQTMEELIAQSIGTRRFAMLLLGLFAGLALVLATVGMYGVMSYSVARRTNEIGVRMALGARQADVLNLILGQGMRLTVVGVTIGLAASFALTRLMESLLFGVSATDSVTYVWVTLLLAAVALLACYVPARRATKVDPMVALRYE